MTNSNAMKTPPRCRSCGERGGQPLQNMQLGLSLPDQFLSLTDWQLKHLKEWADGNFEVGSPPKLKHDGIKFDILNF